MDAVLNAQFQRVDAALGALVESIASYNPSTQAALDLVAADDELSDGLDQLSYHQANHSRILSLRSEAEALEAQLKASVATLANLRQELFETPATTFSDRSRPVPLDELLSYARSISKYTVPPTYREAVPEKPEEGLDKVKEDAVSSGDASGAGTPAVASAPTSAVVPTDANAPSRETAEGLGESAPEISAEEAEWLKKLNASGIGWTPWPSYDRIRGGNLMMVQQLLDQKMDPWKHSAFASQEQEEAEGEGASVQGKLHEVPAPQPPQAFPKRESVAAPTSKAPELFKGFEMDEDDDDE